MGRGRLGGTTQMNSRNPEALSSTPPAPKLFLRSFQTPSERLKGTKYPFKGHPRLNTRGWKTLAGLQKIFPALLAYLWGVSGTINSFICVCVSCTRKGAREQHKTKETWLEKTPKHVKMKKCPPILHPSLESAGIPHTSGMETKIVPNTHCHFPWVYADVTKSSSATCSRWPWHKPAGNISEIPIKTSWKLFHTCFPRSKKPRLWPKTI